jgi:hypothetical protein
MGDRGYAWLAGVLLLFACGEEARVSVRATVRLDAALADEVRSFSIYAFGSERSDGIQLTCTTLVPQEVMPDDSRLDLLDRVDVAWTPGGPLEATLDSVEAGTFRVIFVEAKDGTGAVIANGCTEWVTVESGETVTVEVPVYYLAG